MEELISIIVPVYNTKEYLEECIESVRNQSYKYLELILVDDGSSDGSADICDKYADLDKRIHVIHKDNGGQSSARNRALKECHGKYYMFLDSDDKLYDGAIEALYRNLKQNSAQLSLGGIKLIGSQKETYVYMTHESQVYDGMEACRKMFIHDGLDSNTFAKLYDAELWNNVTFPEGTIFEDVPIMYKIILGCKRVVQCDSCVYEQRSRTGSTTKSDFNSKKMIYTKYAGKVYRDIKSRYPRLEKEAKIYYLHAVTDNFINLSCSSNKKAYEKYWKELHIIIRRNIRIILKDQYFQKRRLRIMCCFLGMGQPAVYISKKIQKIIRKKGELA